MPNVTEIRLNNTPFIVKFSDQCDKGYRTTWLRNNRWYIIFYVFWSKFILVEIVPWITVIILTTFTWKKIRQFQINRTSLLGGTTRTGNPDEGKKNYIFIFLFRTS